MLFQIGWRKLGWGGAMSCRKKRLSLLANNVLVVSLVMVFCLGCGARLYRQKQHSFAIQAQTSFTEARLAESIDDERRLMDEFLRLELEMVRRHTLARRDARLSLIIGGDNKEFSWDYLKTEINNRKQELAGDDYQKIVEAVSQLPDRKEALARMTGNYRLIDKARVTCSMPEGAKPQPGVDAGFAVKAAFSAYQTACENYLELEKLLAETTDVLLGRINSEILVVERQLVGIQAQIAASTSDYKEAKTTFQNALKSPKPLAADLEKIKKSVRTKLDAVSKPLTSAVDALKPLGLQGLAFGGLVPKLKEEISLVNSLLGKIIGEEGSSSGEADENLGLASLLPRLGKEIGESLRFPKVGVLLLESERLRIELDAAKTRLTRANERFDLLKSTRDAVGLEMVSLALAESALIEHEKDTTCPKTGALLTTLGGPRPSAASISRRP